MNGSMPGPMGDRGRTPFFHGTRAALQPGDLIGPGDRPGAGEADGATPHVYLSPDLDAAIWDAELASGEGPGRVYIVEPTGGIEDARDLPGRSAPGHPWMSWRSRDPLRVTGEVTEWPLYHGTRADLEPGDLIETGHARNFGRSAGTSSYVYVTRTLDAAAWGAELAIGEGPGRIYRVEPTGPIENDPDLTNKKFRGNPTKSFRSRSPARITGEVTDWTRHSPEAIRAMKDGVARIERLGVERSEEQGVVVDPRVDALTVLLERHRAAVQRAFRAAPGSWREARPAAGGWSVAQVLEHLMATERSVTGLLGAQLPALELRVTDDFDADAFADEIDMPFFLDRSRRIRGSQPAGVLSAEEAWRALAASRRELLDVLDHARGRKLEALSRAHPATGAPLNGYQWIAFVALHEARHAAQIEAILSALESAQ